MGSSANRGIVPIAEVLRSTSVESPLEGFLRLPTLTWWFPSDAALSAMALSGMFLSVLLLLDVFPKLVLLVLWFLYLSLFLSGRMFTAYQWDMLITETLLAWFTHKLPDPLLTVGTLFAFVVEVIVPFFLFLGRRLRLMPAGLLVLLQVMIAATGNYGVFNVLFVLPCLGALDDSILSKWVPDRVRNLPPSREGRSAVSRQRVEAPLIVLFLTLNLMVLVEPMGIPVRDGALRPVMSTVGKFRSINSYGLCASMTTKQREIIVQGSRNGHTWKFY